MTRKRRTTRRSEQQRDSKNKRKARKNQSDFPVERLLGELSINPESLRAIEGEYYDDMPIHPLSLQRRIQQQQQEDEIPPGVATIHADNERILDTGLEYDDDDFVIVLYYALHEMEKLATHVAKSEIPVHHLFPDCTILDIYEWDRRFWLTRRYSEPYLRSTAHLFDILETVYLSGYLGSMKQNKVKGLFSPESPPRSSLALAIEQEPLECTSSLTSPGPSEEGPWSPEPTPGPSGCGRFQSGKKSSSSSTVTIDDDTGSGLAYEVEEKAAYFPQAKQDSDTPSTEDDENIVHILEYGFQQTQDVVEIKFHIPGIQDLGYDRIKFHVTDRSLNFFANSYGRTVHVFRISRLHAEVDSIKSTYDIVGVDIVKVVLKKKKRTNWKNCECFTKDEKARWIPEMKLLLSDSPEEYKASITQEMTWKNSVRLESSSIDLLKPPATMFENLSFSFSSLDEILQRAIGLLATKPDRQDMIDVIGAIVLRKIKTSKEKKRSRKYTQTKLHSPLTSAKPKPLFAKQSGSKKLPCDDSEIAEAAALKFNQAQDFHSRGELERAVVAYTEAINLNANPDYYRHRARVYFETENYISAYLDSKVAIRSLGVIEGSDCLVLCGNCEISVGNPVCAQNILSSALEILPQINKDDGESIKEIIRNAKLTLPNVLLAVDAIFRRRMRLSVGYLEYVVSFAYSSKGLNIQMAMIYMICQEYERGAILCAKLINKGLKLPLLFYILGKCTYYMGERGEAIAHLKRSLQLRRTKIVSDLIQRIKEIDNIMENGERTLREGNFRAARLYFNQASRKDTTNIRLKKLVKRKLKALKNLQAN